MSFLSKKILTGFSVFILIFLTAVSGLAQNNEEKRKAGLSASFNGEPVTILIPIWVNESVVLAPTTYLIYIEDTGTKYGFGLTLRGYLKTPKTFSPYIGARGLLAMVDITDGDSVADIVAGVLFGGEYFFSKNFSVAIEGQMNASFSEEKSTQFGNPGNTNMNTATVIVANVYF